MARKVLFLPFFALLALTACSFFWEPVKIGYVGNLSGPGSLHAINGLYGATLMLDQANGENGIKGRRLELIALDDRADPDQGLAVDQALKNEGAVAVIGHTDGAAMEKAVPWAADAKQLHISPALDSDTQAGIDDWLFRIVSDKRRLLEVLARRMHDAGATHVAVLRGRIDRAESDAWLSAFQEQMAPLGMSIVQETEFDEAQAPATMGTFDAMRGAGAEAMLLLASEEQTTDLFGKWSPDTIGLPVYMTEWSYSPVLSAQAGDHLDGAVLVSGRNLLSQDARYLDFAGRYREKHGMEPDSTAVAAYEAMSILVEALRAAPDTTPDSLKQTILQIGTFRGLQSEIIFDAYGDARRPICSFRFDAGSLAPLPE